MKVKAWLNHSAIPATNAREARKHKNDILRLSQLLSLRTRIPTPKTISQDLQSFLIELKQNPPDLKSLGLKNQTLATILSLLENVYTETT
ncbi:MAG TPA: hypothetical protein VLE95_02290 [Chlamydiales bacterium]|nr:hypothetical protein [Chlamydiales bacterium]